MRIVDSRVKSEELISPVIPFVSHVGGYNIAATDDSIIVTGTNNATVTLPVTGLKPGKEISVSNGLTGGSYNVTINAVAGPTIGNSTNGTSEVALAFGNVSTFRWSGTAWWVVAH